MGKKRTRVIGNNIPYKEQDACHPTLKMANALLFVACYSQAFSHELERKPLYSIAHS